MSYLEPEEFEKAMDRLSTGDKQTLEYFFDYMKLVMSFGKPHRLTTKGIEYAKKLLQRWKDKDTLTRDEIMCIGVLGTELIVLEKNMSMLKEVHKYYEEMLRKYNPDFAYMQNFTQIEMFNRGYIEDNKNYKKTVENMFMHDVVDRDPEHQRMIKKGVMPRGPDIAKPVCPYCATEFSDNISLSEHVKACDKRI